MTNMKNLSLAAVEAAFAANGYGVKFRSAFYDHSLTNGQHVYRIWYHDDDEGLSDADVYVWRADDGRILADF